MAIKSSASREIQPLIQALGGTSAVERDAAIARLTVIGARGVPHLLDLLARPDASLEARVAALAVLETSDDTRALDAALARLADPDPAIARAAVAVVRHWLHGGDGTTALDRLAATAMDGSREGAVRLGALVAVSDLPAPTRAPLWAALADDSDPQVRAFVTGAEVPCGAPDGAAPSGPAADTPAAVRRWLEAHGSAAPLAALHRLVETARQHEARDADASRRLAWTTTRAQVHEVLSGRDSRVALYDVRETIEAAREPVAPAFLQAAERLGDATLLEPLARTYTDVAGEAWWRDRLAVAARAIIAREKLTPRHAALKRVKTKYPAAFEAFTRSRT